MTQLKDSQLRHSVCDSELNEYGELYVIYTKGRYADLVVEVNFDAIKEMEGVEWVGAYGSDILVGPESLALEIERRLEQYPLLDDDAYSEREWDMACQRWNVMDPLERVGIMKRHAAWYESFAQMLACARGNDMPSFNCGAADALGVHRC